MAGFRVIAIPTTLAERVRATLRSPFHDFPVHVEKLRDNAPCRHCLRQIVGGREAGILCTYDRFAGVESLPQPGPIYMHVDTCSRYGESDGFPEELRNSPRTLEAYAKGRKLLAQQHVTDGRYEPVIEELLALSETHYVQVNSTTAGCFTFRIERG